MTPEKSAVAAVTEAFNAFRDAYDLYVCTVDTALPSDVDNEMLRDRIASLVIGSGDIGIYLRDYGYTIDSLRSLARQ